MVEKIPIEDFDNLAMQRDLWKSGPFVEHNQKEYGSPYCPKRRVFGTLKDGRQIESEK
jgi:hypothetical protein